MKKIFYIIVFILIIIALAGIYKFNYLANKSGYNVDGNKITVYDYINNKYKYSISYPQDWTIDNSWSENGLSKTPSSGELGGDTTISNGDSYVFYIFKKVDKEKSINDIIDVNVNKIDAKKIEKKDININGLQGVKYIVYGINGIGGETKPNNVSVYLKKDDLLVSFSYGFDDNSLNKIVTMDNIINSFNWK